MKTLKNILGVVFGIPAALIGIGFFVGAVGVFFDPTYPLIMDVVTALIAVVMGYYLLAVAKILLTIE